MQSRRFGEVIEGEAKDETDQRQVILGVLKGSQSM